MTILHVNQLLTGAIPPFARVHSRGKWLFVAVEWKLLNHHWEQWWQVCDSGDHDVYLQQQYTELFRNTQDYTQDN